MKMTGQQIGDAQDAYHYAASVGGLQDTFGADLYGPEHKVTMARARALCAKAMSAAIRAGIEMPALKARSLASLTTCAAAWATEFAARCAAQGVDANRGTLTLKARADVVVARYNELGWVAAGRVFAAQTEGLLPDERAIVVNHIRASVSSF